MYLLCFLMHNLVISILLLSLVEKELTFNPIHPAELFNLQKRVILYELIIYMQNMNLQSN